MLKQLSKLKIEKYNSIKRDNKTEEYTVLLNPASYNQKYEIIYEENKAKGSASDPQKFGRIKPHIYEFEFIFDGTGVAPGRSRTNKFDNQFVSKEINRFLKLTGKIDGEIHRPAFLKIVWGSLRVDCILKSVDISYSLFHPNGYPLRAKVKAQFAESIDHALQAAENRQSSPDLTHQRMVKENDTLPMMTFKIYGDAGYYVKVAEYNKLVNFRKLKVGSQLAFPSIKELESL